MRVRCLKTVLATLLVVGCAAEDEPPPPATEAPAPATPLPEIPEYVIADRVEMMAGGVYADIVAPSLSPSTDELGIIANIIGSREGLKRFSLYCSEDAVKANFSASYWEANPEAVTCILGEWSGGVFTPATR